MVRIEEKEGLSGVVHVKNVRSVLDVHKAGYLEDQWWNGRYGGGRYLYDIRGCVEGRKREPFL